MTNIARLFYLTVAAVLIFSGCASNGRPFYQQGPGWEYYYDHFKPELTRIGAGNSPASGEAYDTDPVFFFWNQVNAEKLVLGMSDYDVRKYAALRPDKIYRSRGEHNTSIEVWAYRKDCSKFLRMDEHIPEDNILITLHFTDGRLDEWEPIHLAPISEETLRTVAP